MMTNDRAVLPAASKSALVRPEHEPDGTGVQADRSVLLGAGSAGYDIEIVVPVFNEQTDLAACIHRLRSYLDAQLPVSTSITVADNASTDETWPIAGDLAATLPGVRAVHFEAKGRGGALRSVWLASQARVVAYMDVDLSTDLAALLPLVAPLLSGHSDVSIGSRLSRSSRVVRGAQARTRSPGATTCCCTRPCGHDSPTRSVASKRCGKSARGRCCRMCTTVAGSSIPSSCCSPNVPGCVSPRFRWTGWMTRTAASTCWGPRQPT